MSSSTTTITSTTRRIKFVPFSSAIEAPFWVRYNREKLERIQLSEEAQPLRASYEAASNTTTQKPRMQVVESSLVMETDSDTANTSSNNATTTTTFPNERVLTRGVLLGCNTVEAFQTLDKNALLQQHFLQDFWQGNITALTQFVLLTFADLKQHKVIYWFGFPTLLSATPLECAEPPRRLPAAANEDISQRALAQQVHAMRVEVLQNDNNNQQEGFPPFFVWRPRDKSCVPLTKESALSGSEDSVIYCALDPYSDNSDDNKNNCVVGWPLRNLIAYLAIHQKLGGKTVQLLSFRPNGRLRRLSANDLVDSFQNTLDMDCIHDQSVLFRVTLPTAQEYGLDSTTITATTTNHSCKVTGWELNPRGKPGPRPADLRPLLDPHHLAVQAADLNLKLMKWRMLPNLQVEKLQSTKVLILGAGTLGCNVARCLLGWGVRKFVFCDYGRVGYSNPCRQPLFTLQDCAADNGKGVPKAAAAARALEQIAADVSAESHVVSIPMPGHAESKDQIEQSVTLLDRLVQECDVVYLLTDTRESRWLPTVMAAAHNKLLMNAALGLDSWLVMRHGGSPDSHNNSRLGCYFCNDVVAPENSTKNRTLDQQCTVTRPGLAPIASAMAVELCVALLHHSQYMNAPAPKVQLSQFSPTVGNDNNSDENNSATTPLGIVPHQIRGSLVSYTLMTPTVPAFVHCTGCAAAVVDAYRSDKMELVYQTCQPRGHEALETLSGLTEFRAKANAQLEAMEDDDAMWDDDEEEE
mmetsp:Transcript_19989/g.47728  ORF Transcript_19989/g.47728 Transcript_19989/m.47728 type:complete len:752 (-) Transcript_19989:86-2341(-)